MKNFKVVLLAYVVLLLVLFAPNKMLGDLVVIAILAALAPVYYFFTLLIPLLVVYFLLLALIGFIKMLDFDFLCGVLVISMNLGVTVVVSALHLYVLHFSFEHKTPLRFLFLLIHLYFRVMIIVKALWFLFFFFSIY